MSFFKKKKVEPAERVFVVLPGAKTKALNSKKDVRRVDDLKKDLAQFMKKHSNDRFDTRQLSRRSLEYK